MLENASKIEKKIVFKKLQKPNKSDFLSRILSYKVLSLMYLRFLYSKTFMIIFYKLLKVFKKTIKSSHY